MNSEATTHSYVFFVEASPEKVVNLTIIVSIHIFSFFGELLCNKCRFNLNDRISFDNPRFGSSSSYFVQNDAVLFGHPYPQMVFEHTSDTLLYIFLFLGEKLEKRRVCVKELVLLELMFLILGEIRTKKKCIPKITVVC